MAFFGINSNYLIFNRAQCLYYVDDAILRLIKSFIAYSFSVMINLQDININTELITSFAPILADGMFDIFQR